MENHEEYIIDKSGFPRGEWDAEPDKLNWVDEATNLDCMIVRNHMGNLCGYVAVDESHPLFGRDHNDVDGDLSVHGGLTYADACQGHICHIPEAGRPDSVWWFGFDCAHSGDLVPSMVAFCTAHFPAHLSSFEADKYKNLAYVKAECELLAKQLATYGSTN